MPTIDEVTNEHDFVSFEKTEIPAKNNILELLKSPTGEGDLVEYETHVLNFNNSTGMARVLRGLTGIMGNLNYAIIDILLGILEFMKSKPKEKETNEQQFNQIGE